MREMATTSTVYKKFDTGRPLTPQELVDFARIYEPENPDYAKNLIQTINSFQQQ
jgi:hypothetical protein